MGHATFQVGDLTAVIGDNSADGEQRSGLNGIWSLRHATGTRTLFVPNISGLNHEHIFDGESDDSLPVFFEPRHAPMTFQRISDREAELHQPPTPTFHLESWTRFRLVEPHYIDFEYRCVARQHSFRRGYIGLFWASYINAPEDKSIYFRGELANREQTRWVQLCTQDHYDESTVRFRGDDFEVTVREGFRDALFRNMSPLRFDLPFYYGLFEEHVWITMFDRTSGIRFAHSPFGGGWNAERETSNPAWDFQFIIPDYKVNQEYGFRGRTVFRPRCSRAEILGEYERWREGQP